MRWMTLPLVLAALASSAAVSSAAVSSAAVSSAAVPAAAAPPSPEHVSDWLSSRPAAVRALQELRAFKASGQRQNVSPKANIGDEQLFSVYSFVSGAYEQVLCRLMALGEHSELWVEIAQLGAQKVTAETLTTLMTALEDATPTGSADPSQGILPLEQQVFGQPPDVEGSGLTKILVVDIDDGWSSSCNCSYVAGFFDPVNLSLTDPDSNRADIVYLDAMPAIYTSESPANPALVLGTLAHEYQHLIHANYGNLLLFQNEGQSEWAQSLCGYPSRAYSYLAWPDEINQPLFNWRNTSDVTWDYQRASLFHHYLALQAGPWAMGAVTRAISGGTSAYSSVEVATGRAFEALLADFHVANLVNDAAVDPRYAYSDVAHRGVGVLYPTLELTTGSPLSWDSLPLEYGGAHYLRWVGVSGLEVTLKSSPTPSITAVVQQLSGGPLQVLELDGATQRFPGEYESITLVVVNDLSQSDESQPEPMTYHLDASWTALPFSEAPLEYYDPATLFWLASLPSSDEKAAAVRFTPAVTGNLREVWLDLTSFLDGSANPKGSGKLRLELATSEYESGEGADAVYVPGASVDFVDVPFTALYPGPNRIDVSSRGWQVTSGEEFQLVLSFQETSADASIAFNLDNGSTDTHHPDYYPARTRRYFQSLDSWETTWSNHGNLAVIARVSGTVEAVPVAPVLAAPANQISDVWTDVPFSWYPVAGATSYHLELARNSNFQPLVADLTELTETVKQINGLEMGSSYYWRVRALNVLGESVSSQTFSFTTRAVATGEESLAYYDPAETVWSVSLPFGDETAWAVRFSPALEGEVATLELNLTRWRDGSPNPVGSGALRITFALSSYISGNGSDALYLPGEALGRIDVPFTELASGRNTLDLRSQHWATTAGRDFQLLFEVVPTSPDAAITFQLDNGSSDTTHPDYYPARSRRFMESQQSWEYTWFDHGNFALTVTLEEPATGCNGQRQSPFVLLGGLFPVVSLMRRRRR